MAHLDDTLQIVSRTVRWEGDDRLELDELCADIHKALWELTEVEAVRTALNILLINRNLPTICRCQFHLHLSALTENDEDAIQHFEKAQKQFEKLQTAVYVHGLRDARIDKLRKQVERFEAWIDGSISKPALDLGPSPDYHRPTPLPEEMEEVEEAEKESDSEAEGQNTKGEAVILPTKESSSAQPDMASGEVGEEEVSSTQSRPEDLGGPEGQQLGRSDATRPRSIESIMPIPGIGVDEAVDHTKQGSTSPNEETIVPSTLFPAVKHGVEEVNTNAVITPQPKPQVDSESIPTRYSNGKSKT
ncbi:hypothetical protein PRZ48_001341 [Zasmidium cellare]|uniref:Uncharacterized protein n=1 Tax=Zasmidium cellare TaxID=395010 RepID=A0ABR0F2N7_ZASCE|nr:hypothetical protein PRZ48_001341 [Zasmidium cellare]